MPLYNQYKKMQKYAGANPAYPYEYKQGYLLNSDYFGSIVECENNKSENIFNTLWVYPKGTRTLYKVNRGFTFTLDHSDDHYDYYTVSGSGTVINLQGTNIIHCGDFVKTSLTGFLFSNCNQLRSIYDSKNLPWFGIYTGVPSLFGYCVSLSSIDVTGWDTSSSTSVSIFTNCASLTEIIGIEDWDVGSITHLSNLFNGCQSLESIDLSKWNPLNLIYMSYAFAGCAALQELNLSWNIHPTNTYSMFKGCISLETLDISGWDASDVTQKSDMFRNCNALRTIYMRGCSSDTISKIESALTDAGIRNNVTIVTE